MVTEPTFQPESVMGSARAGDWAFEPCRVCGRMREIWVETDGAGRLVERAAPCPHPTSTHPKATPLPPKRPRGRRARSPKDRANLNAESLRQAEARRTSFDTRARLRQALLTRRGPASLDASDAVQSLATIVSTLPANEGQARELVPVPEEKRVEVTGACVWSGDTCLTRQRLHQAVAEALRLPSQAERVTAFLEANFAFWAHECGSPDDAAA